MKTGLRWRVAGSAVATTALLAACSSGETNSDEPDPGLDGSVAVVPVSEAGTDPREADSASPVDDASPNETNDAGEDAAPARLCSSQNFCHTELPPNQVLRAVWSDGQGTVWSVSTGGSILRWDGAKWTIHASNPDDRYSAIWGSSPTDVWIGGNGKILHGTGASASTLVFTPVTLPDGITADITAFANGDANEIWAIGGTLNTKVPASAQGCLLHYTQGEWSLDTTVRADVAYTRIWSTPSTGLWIGGNAITTSAATSVGLFRRAPGSDAFVPVVLPPALIGTTKTNPFRFDSADATSDTTLVVLGAVKGTGFGAKTTPQVWRGSTSDGGGTFTWTFDPRPVPDPAPVQDFSLTALWVKAPDDTWAAGASGRLQHWNGTAWTQAAFSLQKIPDVTTLSGISGKDSTDFWVVGDNLALHKMP